jgi:hypothetical protein
MEDQAKIYYKKRLFIVTAFKYIFLFICLAQPPPKETKPQTAQTVRKLKYTGRQDVQKYKAVILSGQKSSQRSSTARNIGKNIQNKSQSFSDQKKNSHANSHPTQIRKNLLLRKNNKIDRKYNR